jgi:hypothetical protein
MENKRQIPHNSYGVTNQDTHPTDINNDDGWCAHNKRTTSTDRSNSDGRTKISTLTHNETNGRA